MGLETATYISDLNASNPTSGDAKSQGDDHIRLLKSTIKATFPNINAAMTATDEELNGVNLPSTYTPTISSIAGGTGSSIFNAIYHVTGSYCWVTAKVRITGISSGSGSVSFFMTLPDGGSFASTEDAIGTGAVIGAYPFFVSGRVGFAQVQVTGTNGPTSFPTMDITLQFSYKVS